LRGPVVHGETRQVHPAASGAGSPEKTSSSRDGQQARRADSQYRDWGLAGLVLLCLGVRWGGFIRQAQIQGLKGTTFGLLGVEVPLGRG